jgi:hypothetical protein
VGEEFKAHVVEAGENAKAILDCDLQGVTLNLHGDNVMLFDKVILTIESVSLAMAKIQGEFVAKCEEDLMELR